jgi:SulP family sulfate permease
MSTVFSNAAWLLHYRREWWRSDLLGAITAGSLVIPEALAYAAIAGLPVSAGLYTAVAAMVIYPILGSSRPLSVTTTSELAMLTAAQVAASATVEGAAPVAVATALALLVGGILILASALRLGFLANFISTPVLVGFKSAVGVVIVVAQLNALLGLHMTSTRTLGTLLELPGALTQTHLMTLSVSLVGIGFLLGLPRLFPRLSAPALWIALSIVAAALFNLEALGVKPVGSIREGLLSVSVPDLALARTLAPAALGIALMSFTESVAAARTYWQQGDPPIVADQELLALGAANAASAFMGGMPAGGGTSQTAIAEHAGVRSQLAQWVIAGMVLLILLLPSRMLGLLPKAALSALVLVHAIEMIQPETFHAIGRVRRVELMWALVTFAGVILLGTLDGILIAVGISILTLIYQANRPPVYALAYNAEKEIFRRVGERQEDQTFPGLLMLRTEGRLTFANAANARERMRALAEQAKPKVIVLECSAIADIEYTALLQLTEAEKNLHAHGISMWLAAVNPDLLAVIERSPLGAALGHERMFFDLHEALEAWQVSH